MTTSSFNAETTYLPQYTHDTRDNKNKIQGNFIFQFYQRFALFFVGFSLFAFVFKLLIN